MRTISELQPQQIWSEFEKILQIPRPSKKEEKMIQYLLDFGGEHQLETKRDEAGNVLITKQTHPDCQHKKTIVLQSHIDMVCEKNADVDHDFDHDPIQAYVDGDWVKARGTTLGADDGIGMAAQLAILKDKTLKTGRIECLFTVDEETGLSGARALQPGFFRGKTLINLDSEDEGEFFIGCAGGLDTLISFRYRERPVPGGSRAYKVDVKGLKGGHSGDDIHKGRANAIKILNRFLWNITREFAIYLNRFEGGNLRNAIAREATAVFTLRKKYGGDPIKNYFQQFVDEVRFEIQETEPDFEMALEHVPNPDMVMKRGTQRNVLNALYACPHGVQEMSFKMPGLVQTSTNLASVKFSEPGLIHITTSQRSDIESKKKDIAAQVRNAFMLAGGQVTHTEGYPGWSPNPDSEIVKLSVSSYKKLFRQEPVVRSVHAGLECGLFLEKYPDLDMVSFGPTIRDAHSPDEKLHIDSVKRFWDLLVEMLENM